MAATLVAPVEEGLSLSPSYIWNGNTHVQSECALTDRREGVVLHLGGLVGL